MQDIADSEPATSTARKGAPRLLVSAPVILRALASYLEVTGEAEKFNQHLAAAIKESGLETDILVTPGTDLDRGGPGPRILT